MVGVALHGIVEEGLSGVPDGEHERVLLLAAARRGYLRLLMCMLKQVRGAATNSDGGLSGRHVGLLEGLREAA